MPRHSFTLQRLYVDAGLATGVQVEATADQSNYLRNVMRLGDGSEILLFDGRTGEWAASLRLSGKRGVLLIVGAQQRPQEPGPDIAYVFAPLKRARLDYVVQKAVEMGVARLSPVLTQHTVAERVNLDRLRANVIEAAEQCGVLRLPEVDPPLKFEAWLTRRDAKRTLVFCDERADVANPIAALQRLAPGSPVDVLIGPEGGFSIDERNRLTALDGTLRLALGPRIMRADTAAVAALSLINATIGDWNG
jgi:16S rRNA (uracil1498-N3)-methyltransferase